MASSSFARSAARSAFNRFQRQDFRVLPPVTATRGVDDEDVNDPGPVDEIDVTNDEHDIGHLIESVRRTCGWRHEFDNNRHRNNHRPRHFRNFESELHELDNEMELALTTVEPELMVDPTADPELAFCGVFLELAAA